MSGAGVPCSFSTLLSVAHGYVGFVNFTSTQQRTVYMHIYINKHIQMLGACMYKHVNGPIRYKGLRATKLPPILSSECFQ